MGGGGGGGVFSDRTPEELRDQVRKAESQASSEAFDTELSGELNQLLAGYNDRDVDLVRRRIREAVEKLEKKAEATLDVALGGSVAKHTYVDGLSDIDALLLINNTDLVGKPPSSILSYMEKLLTDKLAGTAKVSAGKMAVTLDYKDGMKIQLLPAMKTNEGLKIGRLNGREWAEIDPAKFTEVLTKENKRCGGKLVPTIKLAKAINGQLPEAQQLSGYHLESLSIQAFKGFNGPFTPSGMLPHLFQRAKDLVLTPIRDRTGQSVHVDSYLGAANSEDRVRVSHILGRVARRMANASASQSLAQWIDLFGE